MLGKIIAIDEKIVELKLELNLSEIRNIIDLYVLISDMDRNYIGEITNIKNNIAYISNSENENKNKNDD